MSLTNPEFLKDMALFNIGMVFQDYALFPHMTIFDNIAFPLQMRKRPKNEIIERVMSVRS
jgi:putative spermidine/putrescine transport system ATP-binding protein